MAASIWYWPVGATRVGGLFFERSGLITFSLQSGSNGNSIYVEAGGKRLLFDAGISARRVSERLQAHGRLARDLDALVLSHDHHDHVSGAGTLHRRFRVPLWATGPTLEAIRPRIGKVSEPRLFEAGDTITFGPVSIRTVPTPHDAVDSVAFVVEHDGLRLAIFTDLGCASPALREALRTVDAAYLESNYDPVMLAAGTYPLALRARISSGRGHLSNPQSALLVKSCDAARLRWVALAHLSAENNDPRIALETHRALHGDQLPIWVAARDRVSAIHRVGA
jgi:phosphoribosyl 1,2-cyclic phosphodiesterase